MFFFFVGGVEQGAGRVLKEAAARCLRCGGTADLVETEKVLKLFFVPVWRWPGKDPAYLCRECGLLAPRSLGAEPGQPPLLPRDGRCGACSRAVDPQFRFCPFCGSAL
ncbi:hypothetical protein PR202_gb01346 [Eleusine coracana subsp. coracana]|uniref:Zinc-ribbon 15 domain-containing protein n=1 Tax=Eleusine coracana subsp. coracana TaxID=191504 RepID=A0AAV5DVN3_ELECO|nr:hypothetical protein QOZ80_5BG0419390 [Eleusine coracana subsp. coracana]GJN14507.1 hypothetical protein PR202_gb01346 [Eleusine coracana subsp. coracana]